MKLNEVPEEFIVYTLCMSDGKEHLITGKTKENILRTQAQFVVLPNKSVINKSFITSISVNKDETRASVIKNKPKLLGKN